MLLTSITTWLAIPFQ